MYDYLIGTLSPVGDTLVVLENNGIGYEIHVPLSVIQNLEDREQKLFIHQQVSENENTLYGFLDRLGKIVFRLLIGVSGVGPRMALRVLDQFSAGEVVQILAAKNIAQLKKIKGLGVKTAEKIIIELNQKSKGMLLTHSLSETPIAVPSTVEEESVAVLVELGYKEAAIRKSVQQTLEELRRETESPTSEAVIKQVLEKLAKLK